MQHNNSFKKNSPTKGISYVQAKSEILSQGISLTPELYQNFGKPYLIKRRGYGNPDPLDIRDKSIPQELYFDEGNIISAVNVKNNSPWKLSYDSGIFVLYDEGDPSEKKFNVTFPLYPEFYDKKLSTGQDVKQVITLYGGKSLAVFVYGTCSLVAMNKPCHYCSIDPNRSKPTDFEKVIKPARLKEALKIALDNCTDNVNQIMLNGGNFNDINKSFEYYLTLVRTAQEAIHESGKKIELHLIVFPPQDVSVLEGLRGLDVSIAMNSEVFDPELFKKYCPGKHKILGQKGMFNALEKAVEVLGRGKVYSLFVGGLEPYESLVRGLKFLADMGVTPVINVFHADPQTPLENHPAPSAEEILKMGKALQKIYQENTFMKPFYHKCGRNSLDSEAYYGLYE